MRKSVYGKLVLGFILAITISFLISGIFAVHQNDTDTRTISYDELAKSCQHISDLIARISDEDIYKILKDYSETSEINFILEAPKTHMKYGTFSKSIRFTSKQVKYLSNHVGKALKNGEGTKQALSLIHI